MFLLICLSSEVEQLLVICTSSLEKCLHIFRSLLKLGCFCIVLLKSFSIFTITGHVTWRYFLHSSWMFLYYFLNISKAQKLWLEKSTLSGVFVVFVILSLYHCITCVDLCVCVWPQSRYKKTKPNLIHSDPVDEQKDLPGVILHSHLLDPGFE